MSRNVWKNLQFMYGQVRWNSNRTCIVKIGRENYCRMYPTVVVNPDGSTYTIRYHEPKKIIKLPVDTSKLSAEELDKHLNRRKEIKKIVIEEQFEDDFDLNRYSHLWKSKSPEK